MQLNQPFAFLILFTFAAAEQAIIACRFRLGACTAYFLAAFADFGGGLLLFLVCVILILIF